MQRNNSEGSRRDKNSKSRAVNFAYLRYLFVAVAVILLILCSVFLYRRYAPTDERMSLDEHYSYKQDNEAVVIIDGVYDGDEDGAEVQAIESEGKPYLAVDFVNNNIDAGYALDTGAGILRYATDREVITVNVNSSSYMVDRQREDADGIIMITDADRYYVSADFLTKYSDFEYSFAEDPARVTIYNVGYEKNVATVRRDAPIRRLAGPKSKIIGDAAKGDQVVVLDNYGKWSLVVTEDGILGCMQNRRLRDADDVVVEAKLEERQFNHITRDNDIIIGWHQVTNSSANSNVSEYVYGKGINVVSPTWFSLSDNQGGLRSFADADYVNYCHEQNIEVWGLVSNLENDSVDTSVVLNSTEARDAVVNELIAEAIKCNLDGINVDFESISADAGIGYIQFIKELSIKCENNSIVLSVDNYVPSDFTRHYNRSVQADYADYVIIMAYDEHYRGSEEAGSVASIGFVEDGVKNTLEEVPAEQIILGIPFYTRIWDVADDGSVTSEAVGMSDTQDFLSRNGLSGTWLEDQGQNYAEQKVDGKTQKVWIEDNRSIMLKLKVASDNKLAGVAFWKLGFETDDVWPVVGEYYKP